MAARLDPTRPEALIAWRAARQHAVVSYRQLRTDGLTRHEIAHRVHIGLLHPKYRAVFSVGHARLTPEGRWMAAVLAHGDDAALSSGSGAALWDMRPSASAWIDVSITSRAGRAARSDIRLHRPTTLLSTEITTHRGIRVTTVERTLLDIAATLPRPAVQRALERAETLRLLNTEALHAMVGAHPRHRGCANLAAALDLYRDEEMTRSDLEAFFRDLCARNDLPRPRVNAIVEGEEVDFLWPRAGLIVEADGRATHLTRAAFERDRARDARLTIAGYRIARFTHRQIESQRDATAATVVALLRAR